MRPAHHFGRLLLVTATVLSLAACGEGTTAPEATGSPTPQPSSPTATSTALPTPSLSRPTTPSSRITTPPPARDPAPLPDNPQEYAKAFVAAWVANDRARAEDLGAKAAVHEVFTSRAPNAPVLQACEGAAGSTYCTWEGQEYTLTVRVQNEKASLQQPHAVLEARFRH